MTNQAIAYEAIRTAQIQHDKCTDRARRENAAVGLADALTVFNRGDHQSAAKRALDSLGYSVGILHSEHARIKSTIDAK